MAIGWFTVLKSVPWTTVISNAPVVADGARKLWKTVANRTAPEQAPEQAGSPVSGSPNDAEPAVLQAQLAEVQQTVARLEQQMLASTELINALAEQNAQLIELVEANRVRTLWLARLTVLLAVLASLALGLAGFAITRA